MGCRGVHFALTDEERAKLIELAQDEGDVVGLIEEEIEERWDADWLCETDKAWDAIHRCLTDGKLSLEGPTPLHRCVLGGMPLYDGEDYIVSFVDKDDVKAVAAAIAEIEEAEFRRKYDAIDAQDYGEPLSDEDYDYTWSNFRELQDFYRKAAEGNRAVIFTVDQ